MPRSPSTKPHGHRPHTTADDHRLPGIGDRARQELFGINQSQASAAPSWEAADRARASTADKTQKLVDIIKGIDNAARIAGLTEKKSAAMDRRMVDLEQSRMRDELQGHSPLAAARARVRLQEAQEAAAIQAAKAAETTANESQLKSETDTTSSQSAASRIRSLPPLRQVPATQAQAIINPPRAALSPDHQSKTIEGLLDKDPAGSAKKSLVSSLRDQLMQARDQADQTPTAAQTATPKTKTPQETIVSEYDRAASADSKRASLPPGTPQGLSSTSNSSRSSPEKSDDDLNSPPSRDMDI